MEKSDIQYDIKRRFEEIFKHLNVSMAVFSSEIGLNNNATISRIVSEKVKPSFEILAKISTRYPQININWLLTGEGPMLKTMVERKLLEQIWSHIESFKTVAVLRMQRFFYWCYRQFFIDNYPKIPAHFGCEYFSNCTEDSIKNPRLNNRGLN